MLECAIHPITYRGEGILATVVKKIHLSSSLFSNKNYNLRYLYNARHSGQNFFLYIKHLIFLESFILYQMRFFLIHRIQTVYNDLYFSVPRYLPRTGSGISFLFHI